MHTTPILAAGLAAGTLMAAPAMASTTTLTQPGNFANPPGEAAATTSPTGSLGNGSWQAVPGVNQHLIYLQGGSAGPLEGGSKSYPTAGKNPRLLFPESETVTIDDIESISFDTKTSGSNDWFVDIFTKSDGVNEPGDGSYFETNLDLVTSGTADTSGANGFTTHSFNATNGATINQDPPGNGGFNTLNFGQMNTQYGSEEILYVALGTATNYTDFDGLIDNFVFEYESGGGTTTRTVDLEPAAVPLPATLPLMLGALGLGGVAVRRRRRAG